MASDSSNNGSGTRKNHSDSLSSLLKSMSGDDCDRPACDDTKSALSAALRRVGKSRPATASSVSSRVVAGSGEDGGASDNAKIRMQEDGAGAPGGYRACPPSKDEIGVSTWSLLHSMAAWYPSQPTSQDKQYMSNFMTALARFYPCTWCAADFQKGIELSPPRTETRDDLCLWLCDQHNTVNRKLGKSLFHCTMDNLDERWRKSSKNPDCQK